MKKKIAHHSLVILVLTVCFGLFQAWKESKNPFAFYSTNKTSYEKSRFISNKILLPDTKNEYLFKLNFKE